MSFSISENCIEIVINKNDIKYNKCLKLKCSTSQRPNDLTKDNIYPYCFIRLYILST